MWLIVAVVIVAIAATAALPRIVDAPRIQSLIAGSASQALTRPVKFRSVSVSILPYPAVRLHGLEIAEDPAFGGDPFLRLDVADLRLKLWPLLRGQIEFATLVLKRPTVVLIQGPDGRWNVASLGTARETATVSRPPRTGGGGASSSGLVSRIVVDQGLVTFEVRRMGTAPLRQRIEHVDLTLSPRAGALSFSGSARVMPGELSVKISEGVLGLSGARTLVDASVRARIELDGKDVRPVAAAAIGGEPALAGAITGTLAVTGAVGRPRATGEIELRDPALIRTSPACPVPRLRTLQLSTVKANVSWEEGRLVVQPLATGIGNGGIATKLSATPGPPVQAELADLVLKAIPLEPVLVDFLCQGYAVTGLLDHSGTLTVSPADPMRTLNGAGQFRIGAGRVVGPRALALLGGVVRVGSPLEFDSIAGTYQVKDGVATTRDLVYTSRAMKARVTGDYALATGRMSFDVVVDPGRGLVHARVTGTLASPSIRVAPSLVGQVEPERVERSLKDLLKKFR